MKLLNVCNIFFGVICIAGFVFQLYQVSSVYFRYESTSRTVMEIREIESTLAIAYCPAYYYMLNRTNHKERGISAEAPKGLEKELEELSHLTIRQILELTPDTRSIIKSCEIRDDNRSIIVQLKSLECLQFFKLRKSVNGERICYRFEPRYETTYSVGNVASSLTHISEVYSIAFHPFFGVAKFGFIITYFPDTTGSSDPLISRIFGAKFENANTVNLTKISVYGESNEVRTLPKPYDTQCIPNLNKHLCYEDCLIKRFETIGKVPWSGFLTEPSDLKMFTQLDYANKTMGFVAQDSLEKCHRRCKINTECVTTYTITRIVEHSSESFRIHSMLPGRPLTSIRTIPYLTLIEYIIQVGSCCGIWFGLSIVSFNPSKWLLGKVSKYSLRHDHIVSGKNRQDRLSRFARLIRT